MTGPGACCVCNWSQQCPKYSLGSSTHCFLCHSTVTTLRCSNDFGLGRATAYEAPFCASLVACTLWTVRGPDETKKRGKPYGELEAATQKVAGSAVTAPRLDNPTVRLVALGLRQSSAAEPNGG